MENTMRPTTAFEDNFNALLHFGTIFDHPCDVLAHPSLSVSEKPAPGRPQGPRHHRRDPGSLVRTRWRPPQSAWRQAEPPVFYVKGAGGLVGRSAMDEIRLPQHVASRTERRWTARFAKMLAPCRPERSLSKRNDTLRSPKFRRR